MRPYILMVVVCHYPRFVPISYKYIFGVLRPLLYSVYSTKSVLYIIYIIVRYRLRARRAYYTRYTGMSNFYFKLCSLWRICDVLVCKECCNNSFLNQYEVF